MEQLFNFKWTDQTQLQFAQYVGYKILHAPNFIRTAMFLFHPSDDVFAKVTLQFSLADVRSYAIHLAHGIVDYNYVILRIALSNNSIFSGQGLSTKKIPVPHILFPNYDVEEVKLNSGYYECLFDEKRQELLTFLHDISTKLLLYHELVHINNGHLDYINETKKIDTLIEKEGNGISAIEIQCLEMDADVISFQGVYLEYRNQLETQPETFPEGIRSLKSLLHAMLFVNETTHLSQETNLLKSIDDIKKLTHLHRVSRLHFIKSTMVTLFSVTGEEHLNDQLFESLTEIMSSLREAKLYPPEYFEQVPIVYTPEGMEYLGSIVKHFQVIKPQLQKYCTNTLTKGS